MDPGDQAQGRRPLAAARPDAAPRMSSESVTSAVL